MSGQGYEELIILNRKLDELLDRYNNLKHEVAEFKNGNEVLKAMLQEREEKLKNWKLNTNGLNYQEHCWVKVKTLLKRRRK